MKLRALGISAVLAMWPVFASASAPGTLFDPQEGLGVGARAAALGGAFAAVPGGLDSLSINPAGLAFVDRATGAWHHHSWIDGITRESVALAGISPSWGVAVGSFQFLLYKTMEERDDQSNVIGSFRPHREDMSLSWARRFGRRWSFGAAVHETRLSILGEDFTTFAGDAGVLSLLGKGWSAGASVGNAATYLGNDASSTFWRLGLGRQTANSLAVVQGTWILDGVPLAQAGFERRLASSLWGRVGARVPLDNNQVQGLRDLTLGFGWTRPVWALDYAYEPQGDLGVSHRLSFKAALTSPMSGAMPVSGLKTVVPVCTSTPTVVITAETTPSHTPTPTSTPNVPSPTPTLADFPKGKPSGKNRLKLFFELPDESPVPTPSPALPLK